MSGGATERLVTALGRLAGRTVPHVRPGSPLRRRIDRMLIVKPCCVGDLIQTGPVLTSLRDAFQDATIDLATSTWSKAAIESLPALSHVVELPRVTGPATLAALTRQVRSRRYDLCLVLDRSPIYGFVALSGGVAERCGYDSLGRGCFLNRRVAVPLRVHELDLALSSLVALGIPQTCRLPRFHVTTEYRERARLLLGAAGWREGDRLVALAPGGGANPGATMPEKRWFVGGYAEIARRLWTTGISPLLIGGPTDEDVAGAVVRDSGVPVIDLTGKTTLGELAAVLEVTQAYVGNDSGTTHLAAAVGGPTVAIFGPTDPVRYGPRGERVRILSARPSPDDRGDGSVRSPWYVDRDWRFEITIDQVWTATREIGGLG